MDDNQFKDLVIRKLEKIEERHEKTEEKHEARHMRLQESVQTVRDEQLKNSIILSQMQIDIPEIKKDLYEHKEGVIQNRHRINVLSEAVQDQEAAITRAVGQYKTEVEPVVQHVKAMQELPGNIKSFIISTSKVVGAIAVTIGSIGTIVAYFMNWF